MGNKSGLNRTKPVDCRNSRKKDLRTVEHNNEL